MSLSIILKTAAVRSAWNFGLMGTHVGQMLASQKLTYREGYGLPKYNHVDDVSRNLRKLRWTEDPWGGRLDIAKHPTYMQEAIEQHPERSGDCDDFALYCCSALVGSGLVDKHDVFFCTVLWKSRREGEGIKGHAVCAFKEKNGGWFWMGNWDACRPIPMSSQFGWIEGVLSRIKNPPLVLAGRIQIADVRKDDTVVPGKAYRCG